MKSYIKHMRCSPISMGVAGHVLFKLNNLKTASNDKVNFAAGEREGALGYNEWRVVA